MYARRILALSAALVALGFAQPATAQIGGLKKLKDKAKEKLEETVKCAADDKACIDKAKADGKKVEVTGGEKAAPAGKAESQAPGEGVWANFDFVPGERVLFFEDFTRDRVGNFPKRLELTSGNGEVVEWNGERWFRFQAADNGEGFGIALPEVLPERFTIEMEMTIPWNGVYIYAADEPTTRGTHSIARVLISGWEAGVFRANSHEGSKLDPRTVFPDLYAKGETTSRPFKFRMQADGKYVKLYLDERRIANIPNSDFARANKIFFFYQATITNGEQHGAMIRNISINAGGKEMYDALAADGRVAVQGIYFDTGSDRIRPESSGTLAEIGAMLKDHADLKLVIEGHTDNVGDAAANQTLSEKRAAAVVQYLTEKESIDASRLQAKGFGASKPAAPNDTPENRQKNRRVELVKL